MRTAKRAGMGGNLGGEAAHLRGRLVGAQEFAFCLVEARLQGQALALGEQVARSVGGADRDTLEPGALDGGLVGAGGGGRQQRGSQEC